MIVVQRGTRVGALRRGGGADLREEPPRAPELEVAAARKGTMRAGRETEPDALPLPLRGPAAASSPSSGTPTSVCPVWFVRVLVERIGLVLVAPERPCVSARWSWLGWSWGL